MHRGRCNDQIASGGGCLAIIIGANERTSRVQWDISLTVINDTKRERVSWGQKKRERSYGNVVLMMSVVLNFESKLIYRCVLCFFMKSLYDWLIRCCLDRIIRFYMSGRSLDTQIIGL